MDSSLAGIAATTAWATFHVAMAIILGGIVSGLVTLGLLQVYAREKIQRAALFDFFETPWKEDGFWRSGLMMFGLGGSGGQAIQASKLLGMPESALCRLYYRQVSGQFLAAVNAEAARVEQAETKPTPVLDYLGKHSMAPPTSLEEDLSRAGRTIDALQARLGDAVTKSAMSAMTIVWWLFFLTVGLFASIDRYETLLRTGRLEPGGLALFGFWSASLTLIMLAALALAFCAAACGLVALTWLDRATAAR